MAIILWGFGESLIFVKDYKIVGWWHFCHWNDKNRWNHCYSWHFTTANHLRSILQSSFNSATSLHRHFRNRLNHFGSLTTCFLYLASQSFGNLLSRHFCSATNTGNPITHRCVALSHSYVTKTQDNNKKSNANNKILH